MGIHEKKILTVTLNPAVDKTYETQSVMVGNVNRMRSVINIAGGKGINVTKILREYDYPVIATGFLGGYPGKFIEEEMLKRGVTCGFLHLSEDTRSNMNILADDGFVTEILEPGPVVSRQSQREFLARYEGLLERCMLVILSGSLPVGVDTNMYQRLVIGAREAGVPVYLDSSGESMRFGMEAKPQLIKPNWKELEYLAGHKIEDREELIEAAHQIHQEGIEKVVVSMGSKGLVSVSDEGVYYARAEHIKAVNTVACGDSVVASYAMSYWLEESDKDALLRACAISAANATTRESASIPKQTAEELMKAIQVEVLA